MATEWSFTISYFSFIGYINVSSKQIEGMDTDLNIENILLTAYPTSLLSYLQNDISVLFIWFGSKWPCSQLQRWDSVNPSQSKESNPPVSECSEMGIWPNFGLGESCQRLLGKLFLVSKSADQKSASSFKGYGREWWSLPLVAGCHLMAREEVRFRIKLTNRRGQRLTEKCWMYVEQNLSTFGFQAIIVPWCFSQLGFCY